MVEGGIGVEDEGAVEMVKCEDCDGFGEVDCYACYQAVQCGDCDGTGEIEKESN